ncbi:MAG: hypoxanthine phosphoribosyltransferase [bacterium]
MSNIKVLYTEEEIQNRVKELGEEITKAYAGKTPHLVCILRGAVIFLSDLIRHIDLPLTIDFMAVSSYGKGTKSSGIVKIIKDLDETIENKNVLIVEDIIDTGLTLEHLTKIFKARNPKDLKVCVLLDKEARRIVNIDIDFVGFKVPDKFIVGYGLDYNGLYRNLPFLGILDTLEAGGEKF